MPTNEELYAQADQLKADGKLDEAAAELEKLLEQDPAYTLAHSALAVIYGRLKQHDEAIRHGLKVCELEPNDSFSYTAMSVTFQRAGKIPEAEDAMARAHMLQGATSKPPPNVPCPRVATQYAVPRRRSKSARSHRSRRCRDAWRCIARATSWRRLAIFQDRSACSPWLARRRRPMDAR